MSDERSASIQLALRGAVEDRKLEGLPISELSHLLDLVRTVWADGKINAGDAAAISEELQHIFRDYIEPIDLPLPPVAEKVVERALYEAIPYAVSLLINALSRVTS